MSKQAFERAVGSALREVPGIWCWHPPDLAQAKPFNPADYIYGTPLSWGLIECKETAEAGFALSEWTPQQRQACERVRAAGGYYWLLVRYTRDRSIAIHAPQPDAGRGGLKPDDGSRLSLRELGIRLTAMPPRRPNLLVGAVL